MRVFSNPLGICIIALMMLYMHTASAWDYDSGWLDTASSSKSTCFVSKATIPWNAGVNCDMTTGRDPWNNGFSSQSAYRNSSVYRGTAYFISKIRTDLPFSRGNCRITFHVVYTTGEQNEDFAVKVNGRESHYLDPTSGNSARSVVMPGVFSFYNGWNTVSVYPYTNLHERWWAQSVWFGDYKGTSFDFRDFERRGENGRRSIRIQCNNPYPINATLLATPSSGAAPLNNVQLRANASAGNGATKYYRFRCKNFTGFSSWRTSPSYHCNYPTVGTYTAMVQVRQSGNVTVSAQTDIVVTPQLQPLHVSLVGQPSIGFAPLTSWLTATSTGGNTQPREYRYRCKSFTTFSSWRRYNRYSCLYPLPGHYVATVQLRQNGSTTVAATANITVLSRLGATLTAAPQRGATPLHSTLTMMATGGNGNVKYYQFKCQQSSPYSGWQTITNQHNCYYSRAGNYVASARVWQSGMTTITASTAVTVAARCGNGIKEAGEQCDDGNSNNTDQCSNSCTINTAQCGNGIVESWGGEQCDDGDQDNTDACTNQCKRPRCGDGYTQSGEQCDDGNTRNGDGCSASCTTESQTGSCGTAQDVVVCSAPTIDLCASGAPSAPSYNRQNRRWEWYCGPESCSTQKRCSFNEVAP